MKFLKITGVVLVLILLLGIVVNLIAPIKMIVSRSIEIERSAATVHSVVNDLSERNNWSPWELADSTMVISFGAMTEGVGAKYSWVSENSGSGEQEIVESRPTNYIKTQLEFGDRPGINYSEWKFEELGGITTVTWSFDGSKTAFPVRFFNLIFQGMVEEKYETGLGNLKEYVEGMSRILIKDITAEVFKSELSTTQYIITMIDTTTPAGLPDVYANAFSSIEAFMKEQGLEREAAPVGIYHFFSDSMVVVEPGIPIKERVEVPEGFNMLVIEPTFVASATHVGPWENIGPVHEAIEQWISDNAEEMNGNPWHVYFNDLSEAEDPANLYTQVHYPIQ